MMKLGLGRSKLVQVVSRSRAFLHMRVTIGSEVWESTDRDINPATEPAMATCCFDACSKIIT